MESLPFEPDLLRQLAQMPMPYGKHQGILLIDLPEPYVVWLVKNAPPKGHLGELMGLLYEVKVNGLEPLIEPLKIS